MQRKSIKDLHIRKLYINVISKVFMFKAISFFMLYHKTFIFWFSEVIIKQCVIITSLQLVLWVNIGYINVTLKVYDNLSECGFQHTLRKRYVV